MRGLRKVLMEKGMWSTELARKSGLISNTINNYVNSKTVPNVIYGAKIAKALNVSMDYIWGNEEYEDPKSIRIALINEILSKYYDSSTVEFMKFLAEKKQNTYEIKAVKL